MPHSHHVTALVLLLLVSTQAIPTAWAFESNGSGDAPSIQAHTHGGDFVGLRHMPSDTVATPFTDIGAALTGVVFSCVAWGDYDNDDDLDIVLTGWDSDSNFVSKVYENDGGTFTDISAGLIGVRDASVSWGDYDNDGDLDILLTGVNSAYFNVTKLYQNVNGTFTPIVTGMGEFGYSSVAWGDYDNDGDLDILLTGWNWQLKPVSKVYENAGGTFTDISAGLVGVRYSSVAWGDYDNDGDLDILLTGIGPGDDIVTKVYENDGGTFTDIGAGLTGVYWGSVAWGDYDNDGDLDILLTGFRTGGIETSKVYENVGGTFTDIEAGLKNVGASSVAWGDYDNDGDLDILFTGWDSVTAGHSKVYENVGGTFIDINAGLTGVYIGSAAWGDYDNDGDLDILLAGRDSAYNHHSVVYENTIATPNTPPLAPANLSTVWDSGTVTLSWESCHRYRDSRFRSEVRASRRHFTRRDRPRFSRSESGKRRAQGRGDRACSDDELDARKSAGRRPLLECAGDRRRPGGLAVRDGSADHHHVGWRGHSTSDRLRGFTELPESVPRGDEHSFCASESDTYIHSNLRRFRTARAHSRE